MCDWVYNPLLVPGPGEAFPFRLSSSLHRLAVLIALERVLNPSGVLGGLYG